MSKTPREIEAIDDVIRAAETARELCEGTIIEQRQRIAELESRLNQQPQSTAAAWRQAKRITELEAEAQDGFDQLAVSQREVADLEVEVERLREELAGRPANGFHHPDCNWWKWDWRHSWDDTDCNCDKVAGPAIAEVQKETPGEG